MSPEELEAYILCGGLGSRLRPTLGEHAKVLAPIAGHPFLRILVEHLHAQGIHRFVLCAGYRAEEIRAALPDLEAFGEYRLSLEDEPLGTGGALRHALAAGASGLAVALNGDSICPLDLRAMLSEHLKSGAVLSLALARAERAADYGSVTIDDAGRVLGFAEKAESGPALVNAGVYLIEPHFFLARAPRAAFSLEKDFFPTIIREHHVHGHVHEGSVLDIGTPERYQNAARELRSLGLLRP